MINGKQSFLDYDMSKAFAAFTLPGFNVESLVAYQRKNVEAFTQANQLVIEGVQAFARRQVEIARQAFDEVPALFRELSAPVAPQDRLAKNADFAKSTFEKGLATSRELSELVAKSNTEAFNVIAKRVTESLDEMRDVAGKVAA